MNAPQTSEMSAPDVDELMSLLNRLLDHIVFPAAARVHFEIQDAELLVVAEAGSCQPYERKVTCP
jgi:hypothetical protein